MNDFAKTLFTELKEELDLISDLGILPVRRLAGALIAIRNATEKLKINLGGHPFMLQQEEIDFFKHQRPRFTCEQFYVLEIFTIETNRPIGDNVSLKNYYEQELLFIKRFFSQYQFLYQYYKYELKELDALFFVRGATPSDIILPETADLDPVFSTSCDYLFAKFMAYERLQLYIRAELKSLENTSNLSNNDKGNSIELKWTGETINLVELAYGIWLTGQVNNGSANITEIIEWLESHFQVKIGTAFRRWQSISRRKKIKPTKYLDQMRDSVLKRLDEENGLK